MAARYWVGGTANWDATAGTKWALTSGGTGGQAVPTSADDVFIDNSSNVTVGATANCKSINFTGATGTFSGSSALNVAGNITLATGMTLTYNGLLSITATSTITSNGKTFPGSITISASTITTLADAAIVTGSVTFGNSHTLNGSTLTVGGSLTANVSLVGTATNIILNGTGTWSGTLGNSVEINTSGTITFGTTNGIICNTTTLLYTTGTVVTTGNTFTAELNGTNILTLNCSAITFNNFIQSGKVTLSSNTTVNGNYTVRFNVDLTGTFNLNVGGNLTMTGSQQNASSTTIILNGTGTWSGSGTIRCNLTINTSGTITISGSVAFANSTLTYTAGTVVTTSSTLLINTACTLTTNGINWNNITISAGTTTINSLLTINGVLSVAVTSAVIFDGTSGVACNTFSCTTAGRTITLKNGITYTVTSDLTLTGTNASRITVKSSTTTHAHLDLQVGATQNVTYTNATWIDSSGGQTINTNVGTLSNTIYWSVGGGNFFRMF